MKSTIHFFSEEIPFKLKNSTKCRAWIAAAIKEEGSRLEGDLNFIFCDDRYLLEINETYLNHSTLTDIITFPHSEESGSVSGDIFISVERVEENAQTFHVSFDDELKRVIIHGVLHLVGYADKSKNESEIMRSKEDHYILKTDFNVSRGT